MGSIIPVVVDFETYYDQDYSLSKMPAEEYIRDERFEIIGVSVQPPGRPSKWITGTHEHIFERLHKIDWSRVYAIGHNLSGFDSLIMTERVGVRPRFWGDTMSMYRFLYPGRSSLAAMAERFGLPEKGEQVYRMKGVRRRDMSPQELADYGEYCDMDVLICRMGFNIMQPLMPPEEMQTIHLFTRMFAEPRLELDRNGYRQMREHLQLAKERLMARAGVDDVAELRSDKRFAELLRNQGVEPPTKTSPTTGKPAYAFAKTDVGMGELLEHPDFKVQALAAARVKTKTTIEESRVERFIGIASRGKLPVPIVYGNTHTGRAAGGGKINMQNMNNGQSVSESTLTGAPIMTPHGLRTFRVLHKELGDETVVTGEGDTFDKDQVHQFGLRDGIRAPAGHKLCVADSNAIELRVAHALAGQADIVQKLAENVDVYADFASELYGFEVTKKTHPRERNHGKVGMLQLQYKSGWKMVQAAARSMFGLELTDDQAEETVTYYRKRFSRIKALWRRCADAIPAMAAGKQQAIDQWGMCITGKNCIYLPRGMFLEYPNLRQEEDPDFGVQWFYNDRRTGRKKKLYDGALLENLCQSLARIIVFDQMLEVEKKWGRYDRPTEGVVLTAHDEIIAVIAQQRAEACLEHMIVEMSEPPAWWLSLPVLGEGKVVDRYGWAK